ncbi:MAG: DNA-directed RNA polymerase subunit alpha [Phycisphaerae bacterium]|nr:DNA-directed RNA polymerase subunit alpha [Phycisphaerales bacterium]
MRIRWRGLELPSRLECDESVSTDCYGKFIVEPFERGFGTTVGNSLRRILLSSLEGAAIYAVKISNVSHEFSTIPGVLEDVTDIILNLKQVVVAMEGEESRTLKLSRSSAGVVTAGDIEAEAGVEVVNPDLHIATLTEDVPFEIEMRVKSGRGYATAADNAGPEQEIGVIPVDSIFSPVVRVRYKTEDTRVGQRTNYDRLVLEVWTRGSVSPEDAIVEAAKILRKHLNPFVHYYELGEELVSQAPPVRTPTSEMDSELQEKLNRSVSELQLSVRSNNCLESARISTIGELVSKTEADVLRFRSFGKTSLREVKRKLADIGLSLGMSLGGESTGGSGAGSLPGTGMGAVSSDDFGSSDEGDDSEHHSTPGFQSGSSVSVFGESGSME